MARWVEQVFDERAEHYDESAMHRALAAAVARFADVRLRERVLDVATGTGLVLRALPARDAGLARTAGVDLSGRMLGVAREHLPQADLRRADADALPYEDAAFDVVLCVAALPYLDDATAALQEWRRCLASGGRVVVSAFAEDGITAGVLRARAAARAGLRVDDANAPWGSVDALGRFAATAGMTVTRTAAWSTEVEPVSVNVLLAAAYPLQAHDELSGASAADLATVRLELEALVAQQQVWTTSAVFAELRAH